MENTYIDLLKGISYLKKDIKVIQRFLRIKYKIFISIDCLKNRIKNELQRKIIKN